ncbi:MAG: hypothetical protein OXE99_11605 [Cellvibrionales bacterium]|nr:hypothetical protein [Cellvibrionales bacterium]
MKKFQKHSRVAMISAATFLASTGYAGIHTQYTSCPGAAANAQSSYYEATRDQFKDQRTDAYSQNSSQNGTPNSDLGYDDLEKIQKGLQERAMTKNKGYQQRVPEVPEVPKSLLESKNPGSNPPPTPTESSNKWESFQPTPRRSTISSQNFKTGLSLAAQIFAKACQHSHKDDLYKAAYYSSCDFYGTSFPSLKMCDLTGKQNGDISLDAFVRGVNDPQVAIILTPRNHKIIASFVRNPEGKVEIVGTMDGTQIVDNEQNIKTMEEFKKHCMKLPEQSIELRASIDPNPASQVTYEGTPYTCSLGRVYKMGQKEIMENELDQYNLKEVEGQLIKVKKENEALTYQLSESESNHKSALLKEQEKTNELKEKSLTYAVEKSEFLDRIGILTAENQRLNNELR